MSFVLWHAGELYTTTRGVAHQVATNGTYGRSVWDDFYAYKLALMERIPTKAISIGSSRAMSVRAMLFSESSHLSAGGAVQSLLDAQAFAREVARHDQKPEAVFFFVDFDWFVARSGHQPQPPQRSAFDQPAFLYQAAFSHLTDLLGTLGKHQFAHDPETGGALIGARARRFADGFRIDGSIRHYSFEHGLRPWPETGLDEITKDPRSNGALSDARAFATARGWRRAAMRTDSFDRLGETLATLKTAGIHVVLILPPVAPNVAILLQEDKDYDFFLEWRQKLADLAKVRALPFYDFTQLPLTSGHCYFDRYHGSEGAYAWILAAVRRDLAVRSHPAARLLDKGALDQLGRGDCLRSLPTITTPSSPRPPAG